MADLVPTSSMLIGVDISSQRISTCKSIITKYHIDATTSSGSNNDHNKTTTTSTGNLSEKRSTIRLYCGDGTTFGIIKQEGKEATTTKQQHDGLVFDTKSALIEYQSRGKRKRMNKSARARERRRLIGLQKEQQQQGKVETTTTNGDNAGRIIGVGRTVSTTKNRDAEAKNCSLQAPSHQSKNDDNMNAVPPFDRVLVDAECSSDGALRHRSIEKNRQYSTATPWDDTNMNELIDLQKRLLYSGFRLLKDGGTLVYSTCSLSSKQNEEVVLWLLQKCKEDAFIIPVSFSSTIHHDKQNKLQNDLPFVEEGCVSGTVRFNPNNGSKKVQCIVPGSGFFLAKIGKKKIVESSW